MAFGKKSRKELMDLQEYEKWILDYIYEEVLKNDGGTRIEAKPEGNTILQPATTKIGQRGVERLISNIRPLVFTNAFKMLDAQVEWILEENKKSGIINDVPWRFEEKTDKIDEIIKKNKIVLPSVLRSRRAIFERSYILYKELVDYRNTIIHSGSFSNKQDKLKITHRSGKTLVIDKKELKSLSRLSLKLGKVLETNSIDTKTERELKARLDELASIHNSGKFGMLPPSGIVIFRELEAEQKSPFKWSIDLSVVWDSLDKTPAAEDFELELTGKYDEEEKAIWTIPSEELDKTGKLELTLSNDQWEEYREQP